MSDLLLRGADVVRDGGTERLDLRIRGDQIVEMATDLAPGDEEVVDCSGLIIGPGLVDLHVHFREPGQEWKEDIASGSAAAAVGGYTAVVAMPNTDPPTDAGHLARFIVDRGRAVGLVDVRAAGCISAGLAGERLAHLDDLSAAGVTIFSDDGHTVADAGLLRRAMEYVAERGALIAQHAEDPGLARNGHMHEGAVSSLLGMQGLPSEAETMIVARDLSLVAMTGARYHVQHVSAAATVELIRQSKAAGVEVTAEVAPHHLDFTDDEVRSMDSTYKMYPPLRTADDTAALVDALRDGTIDAVATDHAPHAAHEKDVPFEEAPRGVTGLETALAAVHTRCDLSPVDLFRRMSVAPAAIAGLDRHGRWPGPGEPANLAIVDLDHHWTVDHFESRSGNSPYRGRELVGKARHVVFEGRMTVRDGKVMR